MTDALKKAHEAIDKCGQHRAHRPDSCKTCRLTAEAHAALDKACEEAKASALQESGYWDSQGKIQEALAAERERGRREAWQEELDDHERASGHKQPCDCGIAWHFQRKLALLKSPAQEEKP